MEYQRGNWGKVKTFVASVFAIVVSFLKWRDKQLIMVTYQRHGVRQTAWHIHSKLHLHMTKNTLGHFWQNEIHAVEGQATPRSPSDNAGTLIAVHSRYEIAIHRQVITWAGSTILFEACTVPRRVEEGQLKLFEWGTIPWLR